MSTIWAQSFEMPNHIDDSAYEPGGLMATCPIGMVINARNDWHMASATLFGEVWRGGRIGCTASLLAV